MGIKWLKDPENMVHKKKRKEKKKNCRVVVAAYIP
jgi:hypothetical protein